MLNNHNSTTPELIRSIFTILYNRETSLSPKFYIFAKGWQGKLRLETGLGFQGELYLIPLF
jgi:hypothetical protein